MPRPLRRLRVLPANRNARPAEYEARHADKLYTTSQALLAAPGPPMSRQKGKGRKCPRSTTQAENTTSVAVARTVPVPARQTLHEHLFLSVFRLAVAPGPVQDPYNGRKGTKIESARVPIVRGDGSSGSGQNTPTHWLGSHDLSLPCAVLRRTGFRPEANEDGPKTRQKRMVRISGSMLRHVSFVLCLFCLLSLCLPRSRADRKSVV